MTNDQNRKKIKMWSMGVGERTFIIKHLNLVGPNNRKNLKIPVFGGPRVYLVIFEFVAMAPQENLIFFDLYKILF